MSNYKICLNLVEAANENLLNGGINFRLKLTNLSGVLVIRAYTVENYETGEHFLEKVLYKPKEVADFIYGINFCILAAKGCNFY